MKLQTRVAWILSVTAGLSPRQRLLGGLLEELGYSIRILGWDRKHERTAAWENSPWPVESICLSAPVGSLSLVAVLPRYLKAVRGRLRSARKAEACHLVVATHFFHLFLVRHIPALWLYDAAEYYTVQLAAYVGSARWLAERLLTVMERFGTRHMCGIVTVDSRDGWLEHRYRRWGRNVHVLWNVPAKGDDPSEGAIRETAAQYAGRHVIAYVGGIGSHKGLSVMLTALKQVVGRHREVLLLLIGPADEGLESVRERIAASGLADHVWLTGPISYRSMLAHLAHAKIGLALYQCNVTWPLVGAGNGRKFLRGPDGAASRGTVVTHRSRGRGTGVRQGTDCRKRLGRPCMVDGADILPEHAGPSGPRKNWSRPTSM